MTEEERIEKIKAKYSNHKFSSLEEWINILSKEMLGDD